MRDTINTDRHIYPLPVGYRVFWAEDTGNDMVCGCWSWIALPMTLAILSACRAIAARC